MDLRKVWRWRWRFMLPMSRSSDFGEYLRFRTVHSAEQDFRVYLIGFLRYLNETLEEYECNVLG